ncbi:MAG: O-antigen ligase domain-containing protein [Spartobacteria bacterium]|nr:O-antigen ligase domain-containing protein [Spartobacteria bacterium]
MSTAAVQRDARNRILLFLLMAAAAYFLSVAVWEVRISYLLGGILFAIALAISFIRGTDALYLVIFAMLFSPEIGGSGGPAASGEGGGGLVLRVEDVLLVATGMGWLLRTAYLGRHFGIPRTPVNSTIGYYIAASAICTLLGVIGGSVRLDRGFFNNLKYFEYFFLYFMILAHVRDKQDIKHMIIAMLIVFFLAMIYGYFMMAAGERVSAPFDEEPNTFGGYIVLLYCVALGILLSIRPSNMRVIIAALLVFAIPPFLFTLSRTSYMAMAGGILAFIFVSSKRWVILGVTLALLAIIMAGAMVLPKTIEERIAGTFKKGTQYHVQVAGIDLDPSASARVLSYKQAVDVWLKSPLFGHGVTGTHFIDGQYMRLLAETGVFGLSTFLILMLVLLREVWRVCKRTSNELWQGAALGFFCGIVAMMVHAIAANTFIIVRIAEPFWLLAGLVLLMPYLEALPDPAPPAEVPAYPSQVV